MFRALSAITLCMCLRKRGEWGVPSHSGPNLVLLLEPTPAPPLPFPQKSDELAGWNRCFPAVAFLL